MLALHSASVAFVAPVPMVRAAAVQDLSINMKESVWQGKKAIPFLKTPPKLDGAQQRAGAEGRPWEHSSQAASWNLARLPLRTSCGALLQRTLPPWSGVCAV
jgi:hypothetical protein